MTVLNLGTKTTQIALFPTAVGASTTTGSAIDLQGYEGVHPLVNVTHGDARGYRPLHVKQGRTERRRHE